MGDPPLRLLLVDDHRWFRAPLAFLLGQEPDLWVVAQADSLAEARRVLADPPAPIDVALVALALPDGRGVALLRDLRRHNPQAALVVLTGSAVAKERAVALEAGAAAVLDKAASFAEIVAAVRRLGARGRD